MKGGVLLPSTTEGEVALPGIPVPMPAMQVRKGVGSLLPGTMEREVAASGLPVPEPGIYAGE